MRASAAECSKAAPRIGRIRPVGPQVVGFWLSVAMMNAPAKQAAATSDAIPPTRAWAKARPSRPRTLDRQAARAPTTATAPNQRPSTTAPEARSGICEVSRTVIAYRRYASDPIRAITIRIPVAVIGIGPSRAVGGSWARATARLGAGSSRRDVIRAEGSSVARIAMNQWVPLVIPQLPPTYERVPPRTYGGTELVVSLLTEELVRRGHDVTLFGTGDSIPSARLRSITPTPVRYGETTEDDLRHAEYLQLANAQACFLAEQRGEFD